jgi:hypothetical protein
MIIDAYATDTTPSHEVRRRVLEALTNEGEPMSEVTYDALRKRLAQVEADTARLQAAIKDLAKYVWRGDFDKLKPETRAALGEKE